MACIQKAKIQGMQINLDFLLKIFLRTWKLSSLHSVWSQNCNFRPVNNQLFQWVWRIAKIFMDSTTKGHCWLQCYFLYIYLLNLCCWHPKNACFVQTGDMGFGCGFRSILKSVSKMTGEAPEVRSDKRNPGWTWFEHQSASKCINQPQSATISINEH